MASPEPDEGIENLLCALLGLTLNRKKNPERGHYGRALEECLSSQRHQWPRSWNGKNPISGGKTFNAMSPEEKLDLLRTLVHWCLTTSEAISAIIKESYKQSRKDDDLNQPLSVQPWGTDTRKRKFFLIDGQVDTPFRIYRESERKASQYAWFSVAGTTEEVQRLARDFRAEEGQAAHRLAARITNAVPMLEEREEKRKRREYRRAQKERFTRPEPGFSLYEGRTRGKRMRYTYDEDDLYGTDENRRSSRQSRTATPADGPTFTASGRQVRSAFGKSYGERNGRSSTRASSVVADENDSDEAGALPPVDGRSRRSNPRLPSGLGRSSHIAGYNAVDELDDESDAPSTGDEWDGDDQDFEGRFDEDDDDAEADASSIASSNDSFGAEPKSLIVRLKCAPEKLEQALQSSNHHGPPLSYTSISQNEHNPPSGPFPQTFPNIPQRSDVGISSGVQRVLCAPPSNRGDTNSPQKPQPALYEGNSVVKTNAPSTTRPDAASPDSISVQEHGHPVIPSSTSKASHQVLPIAPTTAVTDLAKPANLSSLSSNSPPAQPRGDSSY